jgi:uridylate kinase
MKQKFQTFIISLGGSVVVPKNIENVEINLKFLKDFKKLISKQVKLGKKFVIIVGGGKICRVYQEAAKKITCLSNEQLDWVGIYATYLNARLIREIFGKLSPLEIIIDPEKPIKTKKPIVVGAGGKPGWSTDYDAVVLAKKYKAKIIINLSNIDYIYDRDPNKFKKARPLKNLSWQDFFKVISKKWKAGMNVPFDPVASRLAEKSKLKVIILKGTDLRNFEKFLTGEKFKGTTIQ